MNTTNNKSINYSLQILAILAFLFIFTPFNTAQADYYNIPGQYSGGGIVYGGYPQPTYYQVPDYTQAPSAPVTPAPIPVISTSSTNPDAPKTVAKAKTNETKTTTAKVAKASTAPVTPLAANKTDTGNKYANLAANALFGEKGFMPSSLTGWTAFAALILAAVALVRRVFGSHEKYYSTPLKHN